MIADANMPESVTTGDLEPELRLYYEQVEGIKTDLEELIRDLSAAQLLWKPQPDKWSISQCLDHLVTTARTELPPVHRAIADGRSRRLFGHGPFRHGRIAGLLISLMGAPP